MKMEKEIRNLMREMIEYGNNWQNYCRFEREFIELNKELNLEKEYSEDFYELALLYYGPNIARSFAERIGTNIERMVNWNWDEETFREERYKREYSRRAVPLGIILRTERRLKEEAPERSTEERLSVGNYIQKLTNIYQKYLGNENSLLP